MSTESQLNEKQPSRREILKGSLTGALALAGVGSANSVLASNMLTDPTPGVTEGPYWVEELLLRSDVRSDPTTGIVQPGFPLSLRFNVLSLIKNRTKTTPLVNAAVDIWHCNAGGLYSDEEVEGTSGFKFLRGTQLTNAQGAVKFFTIFPGWYQGRTPHIHVRVRLFDPKTNTITYNFVTQMFFQDTVINTIYATTFPYYWHPNRDTTNASDSIYTGASEDGEVKANAGSLLMPLFSATGGSAAAAFNILIDLTDSGYNNGLGGSSSPSAGGPTGTGTPPSGTPPTGTPPVAP